MSSRSSSEPSGSNTPPHFLDTVEGEIALLRGITQARPVGLHRHFHVLAILQSIKQETGQHVTAEDVWTKLGTLYNLEALEELEDQEEDPLHEEEEPPKNSVNYQTHPHFKVEFQLPQTHQFDDIISPRRAATESTPGSPEPPTPSAAHHARKPSNSTSTPAKAMFDSEGELTEEEDEGRERKRSRSVKTDSITAGTTGEGAADDDGDVEMAAGTEEEVAASPVIRCLRKPILLGHVWDLAGVGVAFPTCLLTQEASARSRSPYTSSPDYLTLNTAGRMENSLPDGSLPAVDRDLGVPNAHPSDIGHASTASTSSAPEIKQAGDRTSGSLTDRLPAELFQPILQSAVPQGEKLYYYHLMPKRQVSKRWLEIIDTCPSLWSYIYPGLNEQLLQMVLRNSREQLLDVDFDDEEVAEARINAFFECITPQLRRWKSFSFRGTSTLDLSHFLTKSLPNLRKLKVDVTPIQNTYVMWPAAIAAPLLEDVTLHNFGLKWEILQGIRSLEIHGGGPCIEDLTDLLLASPNIERLVITNNWKMRDHPPDATHIKLSNLRILEFNVSGTPASLAWLFSAIELPSLEELVAEPVYQMRFSTISDLQNLFTSVGLHAGSCAIRRPASELKVRAGVGGMALEYGGSRITVSILNERPTSGEWAALVREFVRSLPPKIRADLTAVRIEAVWGEKGRAVLAQLLPIIPSLHTLVVEYEGKVEDHSDLASALKEQFEKEDGDQRDCRVYLKGGRITMQEKERLEDLVTRLQLEEVDLVDS